MTSEYEKALHDGYHMSRRLGFENTAAALHEMIKADAREPVEVSKKDEDAIENLGDLSASEPACHRSTRDDKAP